MSSINSPAKLRQSAARVCSFGLPDGAAEDLLSARLPSLGSFRLLLLLLNLYHCEGSSLVPASNPNGNCNSGRQAQANHGQDEGDTLRVETPLYLHVGVHSELEVCVVLDFVGVVPHYIRVVYAMDVIVDVDHLLVEIEDDVPVVHPVGPKQVPVQRLQAHAHLISLFLSQQHVLSRQPLDPLVLDVDFQYWEHSVHLLKQILLFFQVKPVANRVFSPSDLASLAIDASAIQQFLHLVVFGLWYVRESGARVNENAITSDAVHNRRDEHLADADLSNSHQTVKIISVVIRNRKVRHLLIRVQFLVHPTYCHHSAVGSQAQRKNFLLTVPN